MRNVQRVQEQTDRLLHLVMGPVESKVTTLEGRRAQKGWACLSESDDFCLSGPCLCFLPSLPLPRLPFYPPPLFVVLVAFASVRLFLSLFCGSLLRCASSPQSFFSIVFRGEHT